MVKVEKRYKHFLFGILFASVTWAVSLYLYWSLTSESIPLPRALTDSPRKYFRKKTISNDIILPYEDNDKARIRAKSKYYDPKSGPMSKNDILRQKLVPQPIQDNRIDDIDDVGMVKNMEDWKIRDEGYKLYGFNALASKNLNYHRSIPDTRHKLCAAQSYSHNLPNASVVICFYNEQFDTLARTLHSILDRTPEHLLHEIILVNDYSDVDTLHETVKLYIEANLTKKVKLFLTDRREGLIRARVFGADRATGQALIFLDSHIEVNVDWIQPLLQRIHDSKTNVVTPIIDIINCDTFQYQSSPIVRGGFNWGLHFKWENLKVGFLSKEEDFIKPIPSPTMAGGLFAINREYFIQLGKYDSGMNIWGGENLEISFRIWQCGGNLEIIPCSRVGHVFRKRRPYNSPDGEDTMMRNSLRVAHVWLDDYISEYFNARPEAKGMSYGDVSSRIELRKRLNCKSFDWYLKNIYPELTLSSDPKNVADKKAESLVSQKIYRGRNYTGNYLIKLSDTNLCVASQKDIKTRGSLLVLRPCLRMKNQVWYETDKGELRLAQYLCLDASGGKDPRLGKCHEMGGDQEWKHKGSAKSPLYNIAAGTCLAVNSASVNAYVRLKICMSEPYQLWDMIPV